MVPGTRCRPKQMVPGLYPLGYQADHSWAMGHREINPWIGSVIIITASVTMEIRSLPHLHGKCYDQIRT